MISAERRRQTALIIKKRVKQVFKYNRTVPEKILTQPHRLYKTRSLGDCQHGCCASCHREKLDDAIPETLI